MLRLAILASGVVLVMALTWETGHGEDQPKAGIPPADNKEAVMRRKLAEAQKLLEGLALNDYAKIKAAADELAVLRQKASFMAFNTQEYTLHSDDFKRNIEALQKAAKNKSIDAATLAYVDMTLTCVRCHQYVRETRVARVPSTDVRQVALQSP